MSQSTAVHVDDVWAKSANLQFLPHQVAAPPAMAEDIQRQGYAICKMEGCLP